MKLKRALVILLIFGIILVVAYLNMPIPGLITEAQVDARVQESLSMYPGAELQYTIRSTRNGYGTTKIYVYWTETSFDEAQNHTFIVNFRKHSTEYHNNAQQGQGYYINNYYLSDLPQNEMDNIIDFGHDLCCYGNDPARVTWLVFALIAADSQVKENLETLYFGYGDGFLNPRDLSAHGNTGTFIIYGYRIR